MKFKQFSHFLVYASAFVLFSSFDHNPGDRNEILLKEIIQEMNSAHLQPMEINDSFSEKFYDHYMKMLDGNKRFLHKKTLMY